MKIENVFQAITNIGVLIGIAIVIYEIRETRIITQTQLVSEAHAFNQSNDMATIAEEAPAALAMACFSPERITEKDAVVLDAYFESQINEARRLLYVEQFGFETPWEGATTRQVSLIAASDPGKAWLKTNITEPRLKAITNEVLAREVRTCAQRLAPILGLKGDSRDGA